MQPTRRSTPVPSPRILKYVLTWLSLALILAIGFGSLDLKRYQQR